MLAALFTTQPAPENDLALTKTEIERLPEHKDPPAVRWRPGDRRGGFFSRLFRR
jgi:hypothetical protein